MYCNIYILLYYSIRNRSMYIFLVLYIIISNCSVDLKKLILLCLFIFRYRLGVIDHGQFSFIDIKHKEWPVVLITNPKHALYMMPRKENIMSVIKSTHIR